MFAAPRVGLVVLGLLAVIGGLFWFANIVRKAERADAIEKTVIEIGKMEKRNVEIRNADMPAFCAKFELDYLPVEDKCG